MNVCTRFCLYSFEIPALHMAFMNNVVGGFGVAFGVLGVLAIANGLSTYIFDGQSIQEKVNSKVGAA